MDTKQVLLAEIEDQLRITDSLRYLILYNQQCWGKDKYGLWDQVLDFIDTIDEDLVAQGEELLAE